MKEKKIIHLTVDDETVEFVDTLVTWGFYKDRSEALREILKLGREKLRENLVSNFTILIDKILEFEKKIGKQVVTIPGLRQTVTSDREM